MEEVFSVEINGEDHIVKMATWWLQDGKEIVAQLKGQDKQLIVRDHILGVETIAGLDDAIVVTGKKWQYLFYRSDYLDTPTATEIKRWRVTSIDEDEKVENEILAEINAENGWTWHAGQPEIVINGNRMTQIGAAIPIHTDRIKAIVKVKKNSYIAISKRHRYLLKGEATNPAC